MSSSTAVRPAPGVPPAVSVLASRPPSRRELRSGGKAQRRETRLEAHAHVMVDRPDRDAVRTLRAQEGNRESGLVPLRYGRMAVSPFAFLRGAAAVMAEDLAAAESSGLYVQLCGDAHVANFGMFAAPDRALVFDLNDFDETFPGPFEWDVKRLATSIVVGARDAGVGKKKARRAARAAVEAYRSTVAELAELDPLGVWYARVDVDELAERLRGTALGKAVRHASRKSRRNTGDVAVRKLTDVGPDGRRRFRTDPPLLVPVDDVLDPDVTRQASVLFARYLTTLPQDRAALLSRYGYRAMAHKVVGVGSVGTRALVLLLESGDGEALLLQVKQAGRSVLESALGAGTSAHAGRRVVDGQRLLQAAGDPFLGWAQGTRRPRRDYYVRQLRDMKGGVELADLDGEGWAVYGRVCGSVLARAHSRAGSAAAISGYLGRSSAFDKAVTRFAVAYAEVTERDHAALCAAIAAGEVPADPG